MLARTGYFDEVVRAALKEDTPQIVFLGSGYDSRPYRFAALIRDTVIFELDTGATLSRKQECLAQAHIAASERICYVPIDLAHDDLMQKLTAAGYRRDQRTLFIWEGVTYYLNEEAVRGVLAAVKANSPAGSAVCFDYAEISAETLAERGGKAIRDHMREQHAGEPARFGLPIGAIRSFVEEAGFELVDQLTSAEMKAKYAAAATGQVPMMFCLARAQVK
jgi:methyltransferase (TIGR00027 family)